MVSDIAYHHQGLLACKLLGKPQEILFFGECGEYELVFTIPPGSEPGFLSEAHAQHLIFRKLGVITNEKKMILRNGKRITDLTGYSIFARDYRDVKEYIREVVQFIEDGST
jgi:thiamine-monophosphate kinase